jgi:hypothetical protein
LVFGSYGGISPGVFCAVTWLFAHEEYQLLNVLEVFGAASQFGGTAMVGDAG